MVTLVELTVQRILRFSKEISAELVEGVDFKSLDLENAPRHQVAKSAINFHHGHRTCSTDKALGLKSS